MGYSEVRQSGLWKDMADALNYNFNEISADILGLEKKTEKSKGLFKTEDALKLQYPNPLPGFWALVGETAPFQIYVEEGGQWKPSGGTSSISVPLGDYLMAQQISDITEIL